MTDKYRILEALSEEKRDKRMTDERMAEIESRWNDHKSILLEEYQCPEFNDIASSFESQFDELLQALKAERERVEELEAEYDDYRLAATKNLDRCGNRIKELEAERDEWKRVATHQAQLHADDTHELQCKYEALVDGINSAQSHTAEALRLLQWDQLGWDVPEEVIEELTKAQDVLAAQENKENKDD